MASGSQQPSWFHGPWGKNEGPAEVHPPCLSCPLLVVFGITSLNKGYHDLITLWAAETGYMHQGEQLFFTKSKCFW